MEWEGGFTNKTVWTCLYACYLYNNFFLFFGRFLVKKNFFFEFTIVFLNLMKMKIKLYLKKIERVKKAKNKVLSKSYTFTEISIDLPLQ